MSTSEKQLDEFHGQGGSYVLDPKTGKRTLVERTQEAAEAISPSPSPARGRGEQIEQPTKTDKE